MFFAALPADAWFYGDAPELVPANPRIFGDYSALGLQYRTRPQRVLAETLDAADPERDAVLFLSGSHELHRLSMATHGEFALRRHLRRARLELVHPRCRELRPVAASRAARPAVSSSTDTPPEHRVLGRRAAVMLSRSGARALSRELLAERLLVVVPCSPCSLGNAGPAEAAARVDLGAGFTAVWLSAPGR